MKPVPITKRKREEDVLTQRAQDWQSTFDAVNDMVWLIDKEQRVLRANKKSELLFKRTRDELVGVHCWEIVHGTSEPIQECPLLRAKKSLHRETKKLQIDDGWYSVVVDPILDATGQFAGAAHIVIDITERKRTEETLQKSEAKLKEAQALGRIGSWEFDLDKQTIQWSDQVYKLYERDPSIGPPNIEEEAAYYSHEQAERLHEYAHIAAEQGRAFEYDLEVRLPSGRVAHFAATLRPIKDESGRIFKLFGTVQDITERKRAEEKLKEGEEKYRSLTENINIGIYRNTVGPKGKFIEANPAIIKMFGYKSKEEFLGINVSDLYHNPEDRRRFNNKMIREGFVRGEELWLKKKDGTRFIGSVSAVAVKDAQGHVLYYDGIIDDITERIRSEKALQASEARYRQLVEKANEAIVVIQDGLLKFVNPKAIEMSGYSEPELISRPFPEFIHPDDREMVVNHHRKRMAGDMAQPRYTFRFLARDGNIMWAEIEAVLIDWEGRPATLNFLTDITDHRKAEEVIQASLREKEVMLREIHHRVKNNMQVISSLFNLQAGKTRNTECRKILKEGQTRLRAMGLVHEKLYQSPDLSKIDLAVYVRSLAVHLFNVYLTDPDQVRLEMNFEEVPLDINSAVPCGLILNELISNSLKHAFPKSRKGMIRIGVRPGPDDTIIIRVADDGIGFPKNLDYRQAESLGLQITNLLVGQLGGTIELNRENGTIFTVTFRKLKYAPRI